MMVTLFVKNSGVAEIQSFLKAITSAAVVRLPGFKGIACLKLEVSDPTRGKDLIGTVYAQKTVLSVTFDKLP